VGFIQVTKSKYQSHKWVMDTLVPGQHRTLLHKAPKAHTRTTWWGIDVEHPDTTGLYTRYQKHIPDWPTWWVIVRLCVYISRSPSKEAIELWWVIGTWDGPNNMIVFWYQRGWTVGMKKVQSKVIAGQHINSCWIEAVGVTLINNLSYSIIVFGYLSLAAERDTGSTTK
jgi:hypothetical protein